MFPVHGAHRGGRGVHRGGVQGKRARDAGGRVLAGRAERRRRLFQPVGMAALRAVPYWGRWGHVTRQNPFSSVFIKSGGTAAAIPTLTTTARSLAKPARVLPLLFRQLPGGVS